MATHDHEITKVRLGGSVFEAELIEARLRSDGFTVAVNRQTHPETGGVSALGHAELLVRADQEAEIRDALVESGVQLLP